MSFCSNFGAPSKYFHEVGTEMLGNHLMIRIEKDKSKANKKKEKWEPPCDCHVIHIKRPTNTKGPKIMNGGDKNMILFQIHSKAHLNKKQDSNYRPQGISYKINKSETKEGNSFRKITIQPHLDGPLVQDIIKSHTCEDNHDIYSLCIKKKNDISEICKSKNLELKFITPKLSVNQSN